MDNLGNVRLPENPIVISSGPLVGLGDWAIYSTLAKRFADLGYDVYYDKDNAARNDEIVEIFQTRNPHFKGPSDQKPNAGYVRQGLFYEIANRYPIGAIEAMERAHGLPGPYSIAPSVNYEPKRFPIDISAMVLVDFSAVSSNIGEQGKGEFLRAMKGRFRNAPFLQLIPPKFASLHPPTIAVDSVQIDGIYQYLDALASARAWVGSEAGGQSLAAAARGEHRVDDMDAHPELVVCCTPKTFNSRGYTYAGADYRVTIFGQDKSGDYFFPDELNRHVYELRCAMSFEQMRALK